MTPQSVAILLLLLAFQAAAQICQPNESPPTSSSINTYQSLRWPTSGSVVEVSDNQQHRWTLRLADNALSIQIQGYYETRVAIISSSLQDSWTGNTYLVHASGTFPPLGLRISPDFKWTTLYDVEMTGALSDGSLQLHASISYADFWTDSPANDLYTSRSASTYSNCSSGYSYSSGNNYIQTKGFWIAFSFDDGSNLYFNIPPGAPAFVEQSTNSYFSMCY